MPVRYFALCLDIPNASPTELAEVGETLICNHWTMVDACLFVLIALPEVGDEQAEASARGVLAGHGVRTATFSIADVTSTGVRGRTCRVP